MARAIAPRRYLASLQSRAQLQPRLFPSCQSRRCFQSKSRPVLPGFAFAFEFADSSPPLSAPIANRSRSIDGVLVRSSEPLPRAKQALKILQRKDIPFILLTNGGGKHEAERVAELSRRLEVPLDTAMFVQSHTPVADMVHGNETSPGLEHECILVVGGEGDRCRRVAEHYGFANVVTPSDIYNAYPHLWPFSAPFASYHASHARPLPLPVHTSKSLPTPSAPSTLRIAAIFVFNDPRDWGLDAAVILDLLLSHRGLLGTRSPLNSRADLPNRGYLQDGPPPLYWSNPDLWFAAQWHQPRLGAGGFRAAFDGLWREVTGGAELKARVGGKPHRETFAFAERRLLAARSDGGKGLSQVYMVGDNPASDILGANSYKSPKGIDWTSILVKSGVYAGESPPGKAYVPDVVVEDVWEAVTWAMRQEGEEAELVDQGECHSQGL